jgi:two-component system response regulator GlrR
MKQAHIFLLDLNPETDLADRLHEILESSDGLKAIQLYHDSVKLHESGFCDNDFLNSVSRYNPDILFFIVSRILHLKQSLPLFQSIKRKWPDLPVVVVMEEYNPEEIFTLLKLGAADFISLPLREGDLIPRIRRLLHQTHSGKAQTLKIKEKIGLKKLIGECPVFIDVINKISLVAKCDATVLISGKTGTGKELCARSIHYLSSRRDHPFIPVNCGAIPTELVENELFGHVRSAFTGASTSQPGLIKEADGGTLFLDDIDCLPISAQAKLLRFLQEKEVRQLGSTKMRIADVRVITATNVDLEKSVSEGKLRQDLYYRLIVIPLLLPTLKNRKEDIPLLAHHFLKKYAAEFNKPVTEFAPEAMQKLLFYEWPGNVRQLESVVERAVLFSEQPVIRCVDIIIKQQLDTSSYQESFNEAKVKFITQFEIDYIQTLLRMHQGNITKAAHAAQKNRRAFWQLIRKHQIDAQAFRA